MKKKQKETLDSLNEKLVALQNKCNRAQSMLAQAEEATTNDARDRLLKEAQLELE